MSKSSRILPALSPILLSCTWLTPLFIAAISLSFASIPIAAEQTATNQQNSKDWVSVSSDSPSDSFCSMECQFCSGYYQAPPRRDLGLESQIPNSIFAAADDYEYDKEGNARLIGDVVLQQGPMQLEAEEVNLYQKKQEATAEGSVRLRDQGFLLEGDSAKIQLQNKDATIENASYLDHQSGIQGRAESLSSINNSNNLTIRQGYYTSCPRQHEDWYLKGKKIKLDRESGWGTAKHMRLHFKKVPIFYAPYIKFPIDDRRHSGLLIPNIDLKEPDIAQPIYWNIAPNYDATITPRRIGRRGEMLESQFRYLTPVGAGEIHTGYLGQDGEFDYQDRKLFNWNHLSYWQQHWELMVDTTYLSDNDYLNDLGSDLSVNSQSHLNRQAKLSYHQGEESLSSTVSLWVQAFQTIDDGINDAGRPYRRVPELEWLLNWSPVERLSWNQTLEWTRFEQLYRTDFQESDRLRYKGKLSYRWETPWAFLEPAWQVNHVQYDHRIVTNAALQNDSQSLTVPTVSLDSGIFLERTIQPFKQRLLQTLEPRVFFLWTPFEEQNDHPNFDTSELTFDFNQLFRDNRFVGGDRFGDNEQVSVAVTSRIISTETGDELLSASIGQAFYLADREVQLTGSNVNTNEDSPIASQLTWKPNQHWRWQVNTEWDSGINQIISGDSGITFIGQDRWDQVAHIFNLGYRYASDYNGADRIEQGELSSANKLNQYWTLYTRWLFDLENRNTLEQLTGLSYESCCWRASLLYQRRVTDVDDLEEPENRYGMHIQLELKGLASLGGKIDRLLDRGINGYTSFFGKKFSDAN